MPVWVASYANSIRPGFEVFQSLLFLTYNSIRMTPKKMNHLHFIQLVVESSAQNPAQICIASRGKCENMFFSPFLGILGNWLWKCTAVASADILAFVLLSCICNADIFPGCLTVESNVYIVTQKQVVLTRLRWSLCNSCLCIFLSSGPSSASLVTIYMVSMSSWCQSLSLQFTPIFTDVSIPLMCR